MPTKIQQEYLSTLSSLNKISMFGSKPGLQRISKLLSLLNNPQNNFKCILVGGTNGKGSTTQFLASILESSGYKTGSYFSPPIFSFRERIQLNGKPISKKDFCRIAKKIFLLSKKMKERPSFFEIMTAMALEYYSQKKCDFAVLEVGMGGRLDATNACEPMLSIICSIGMEHTLHLGKTTRKISFEKAGIMRKGKPIICGAQGKAKLILKKFAKEKGAIFILPKKEFSKIKLCTSGIYQRKNCAMAATAASLLCINKKIIFSSLSKTKILGRWQKISTSPSLTIDCAHNPPAAREIIPDLKKDFSPSKNSPRILLFGAMKDKDYSSALKILLPYFDSAIFCSPPYARAEKSKNLLSCAKKISQNKKMISISSPDEALKKAKSVAGKNGRILCTGSIYLLQYLFGEHEFRIMG